MLNLDASIPGETFSMKILKFETDRGIIKSYQYHPNIYKSCLDFPKEKGCGKKIKLATPIFILNSK